MNLIVFSGFFPKFGKFSLLAIILTISPMTFAAERNRYLIPPSLQQYQAEEFPESILRQNDSPSIPNSNKIIDLNQSVVIAANWHPEIAEAVSKLREKTKQVDFASAKYYPQIMLA